MTPKWHRRTADALRAAVDRADTWINGPDDDATDVFFPALTGTDDQTGLTWTPRGIITIPPADKVSPNVDHEPPPPRPTHPECAVLVDNWATKQAEADATAAWADDFHDWWMSQSRRSTVFPQRRLDAKVRDYHLEAARIAGAS